MLSKGRLLALHETRACHAMNAPQRLRREAL
jgi:hypothetical protein